MTMKFRTLQGVIPLAALAGGVCLICMPGCGSKTAAPKEAGVVIQDINSSQVSPQAKAQAAAAQEIAQQMGQKMAAQSRAEQVAHQKK